MTTKDRVQQRCPCIPVLEPPISQIEWEGLEVFPCEELQFKTDAWREGVATTYRAQKHTRYFGVFGDVASIFRAGV